MGAVVRDRVRAATPPWVRGRKPKGRWFLRRKVWGGWSVSATSRYRACWSGGNTGPALAVDVSGLGQDVSIKRIGWESACGCRCSRYGSVAGFCGVGEGSKAPSLRGGGRPSGGRQRGDRFGSSGVRQLMIRSGRDACGLGMVASLRWGSDAADANAALVPPVRGQKPRAGGMGRSFGTSAAS